MAFDWSQISKCELVPLPPGTCKDCGGEGYLYPELWIADQYWPAESSETWDPDDAIAASCVACKASGETDT